jgi:adhesin transport system membrane fusion protein
MVAVVVLFVLVAGVWAQFALLDVAVQARGAVVPPSRLQEVTSLEGGIVKEMRVVPGQVVRKGELLARLDTAQYQANLGESRQLWLAAQAGRSRVEALLANRAPDFSPEVASEVPELVAKEMQLWRDGLREYQSARAAAGEAVLRRRGEIAETEARIRSLQTAVAVGEESFAIEERLFREGAGARADYLAAQQRLLLQKAELDGLQQSQPRLRAGLAEAQAAAAEIDARARAQWGAQRTEYETRAASLAATLGGREDQVARREVFSPVDGVVNRVLVPTLGGVALAGKPILEIVPEEARLLMTVRVRPSDIGFLHTDQKAHVRVLAYDSATHGQLDAAVERVGADALVDERGEAFFEVQLTAERDQIKLHGKPLPITPGMPVDVSILTGERSVMQYLLKPVLRGIQGSLRER